MSREYRQLVCMYCGDRPLLGPDISLWILEFAGMCGKGRRSTFFVIYS